jgi:hypothetical protein
MSRARITLVLLALLIAWPAAAQISSGTGAIQGTVLDPQGAAVAGAKVVATNLGTGIKTESTTTSEGTFVFSLLSPGNYKVEVEMAGFKKAVLSDVNVAVTKVTNATVKLELGEVTSEIIVSEAAIRVDTLTATTGDVINSQLVRALPLATRNFLDLTSLQAGVAASMTNPAALGRGAPQLFVAGQRGTVNNFVLNGVDANNYGNNNFGNVPVPNPDAVQEFRVNTSLYDASQGRGSGGNINVVQRSGTSQYHGSAFWFYRSDALNANDFFFNRNNVEKPVLLQNQYGGTIGGPVPGLAETFWFFSYQGMRQKNGVAGAVSGTQPVLPATRDAASLAAAFGLTPAQIDPVALAWLNRPGPYGGLLYPSGICQAASGCTTPAERLAGSFSASAPSIFNEDQYNATFDHQLWSKNRVSVKFFYAKVDQNNPLGGGVSLGQGQANPQKNTHAAISDQHTFSSSLLNEFRAGFTLLRAATIATEGTTIGDIGMSRFNSSFYDGTPAVFYSDGSLSWGGISTNNDQASANFAYTIADTVSWTRGKHTVRGGVEFRRYHVNTFNNFASRGFLNFPTFIDFLTGTPNDIFVGSGITDRGYRAYDFSVWSQDDYRITRRITLNLGLRWDLLQPSIDIRDRLGNFDPDLITPACRQTGGNCLRAGFISPEGLGGGFGTPGVSRSTLFGADKNNFAPRIGVAWDVLGNGKLSVRSGFGVYFIRTSNQTLLQLITAAPFFQLFRNTGTAVAGSGILNAPFPASIPTPDQFPILPVFPQFNGYNATGTPLFIDPATGGSVALITVNPFERNLRTPYTQQWNATAQYEFLRGWVAEVGYIGSRGIKLLNGRQVNNARLVNANNPGLGGLTANSSVNVTARTLIPGFSQNGLNMVTGSGDSWYQALLVSVTHNFAKGFLVKANYTFSKSLDTNSGATTQDLGNSGGNQLAPFENKGLSIFDQRHRAVFTYSWSIPGPKSGWMEQVFGGWELSGVTIYQSGFPFDVRSNGGNLVGLASATARANVSCGDQFTMPGSPSEAINNYILASCFSVPTTFANGTTLTGLTPVATAGSESYLVASQVPPGAPLATGTGSLFGNSGRGLVRAPFQNRWDMSVAKNFPMRRWLGEQGNLQFRAEFFKLFNSPIFGFLNANNAQIINNNIASAATFGRLTGTVDSTGRVIQFALKLSF